jgi:hypothetical protein
MSYCAYSALPSVISFFSSFSLFHQDGLHHNHDKLATSRQSNAVYKCPAVTSGWTSQEVDSTGDDRRWPSFRNQQLSDDNWRLSWLWCLNRCDCNTISFVIWSTALFLLRMKCPSEWEIVSISDNR